MEPTFFLPTIRTQASHIKMNLAKLGYTTLCYRDSVYFWGTKMSIFGRPIFGAMFLLMLFYLARNFGCNC